MGVDERDLGRLAVCDVTTALGTPAYMAYKHSKHTVVAVAIIVYACGSLTFKTA